MGNQRDQVLIHYLDDAGRQATNFWTLAEATDLVPAGLVTLAEAIQECVDVKVTAVQLQTTHLMAGSFGGGPYKTVMDRAALLGQVGGNTVGYDLVGPKAAIFQPDGKRVDLTNADVMALVAAMTDVLGNGTGTFLSAIKRGTRQWASTRS